VALNVSWSVEKVQIPADVVLAIDSSGSMIQTDAKDERKSASRTFVELMEKGDSTKYRVVCGELGLQNRFLMSIDLKLHKRNRMYRPCR